LTDDIINDIILIMKNKIKLYSFDDHLEELMRDLEFVKEWGKTEPEYLLAKEIIEKRVKNKMSQRTLAKKLKTSQAAISRIESMNGNPSFSFLKRLASALDSKLILQFK